jgi:hypothetical protein
MQGPKVNIFEALGIFLGRVTDNVKLRENEKQNLIKALSSSLRSNSGDLASFIDALGKQVTALELHTDYEGELRKLLANHKESFDKLYLSFLEDFNPYPLVKRDLIPTSIRAHTIIRDNILVGWELLRGVTCEDLNKNFGELKDYILVENLNWCSLELKKLLIQCHIERGAERCLQILQEGYPQDSRLNYQESFSSLEQIVKSLALQSKTVDFLNNLALKGDKEGIKNSTDRVFREIEDVVYALVAIFRVFKVSFEGRGQSDEYIRAVDDGLVARINILLKDPLNLSNLQAAEKLILGYFNNDGESTN